MASGSYRFDRFRLDPANRRLWLDETPVELNARYLDALILLVREDGRLVTKERFLAEVWKGVPVTDEALTQCVRTLRSRLGDAAGRPRFIETAPKHGYRFIAPVSWEADAAPSEAARAGWTRPLTIAGAAMLGGGIAGALGGLFYGVAGVTEPTGPGMGATSVVLVLVCLTALIGVVGAGAVGLGMALANRGRARPGPWSIAGGAAGGLVVGGLTKLIGSDAFSLLFGQSPGDITGAPEGIALGAGVGLAVWLAGLGQARLSARQGGLVGGLVGAGAGLVIAALGGRLMAGSLELVAIRFPQSRLSLEQMGGAFGEAGLGPLTRLAISGVEGLLFTGCVTAAVLWAWRATRRAPPPA